LLIYFRKGAYYICHIYFIHQETDYIKAVLIQSSGIVIAGIISMFIVFRNFSVKLKLPKAMGSIFQELKEGGKIFSAT
jgi:PST family polysaccharide transporter